MTYIEPQRTRRIADQEEAIFQIVRLINEARFGGAVFADYVISILGSISTKK